MIYPTVDGMLLTGKEALTAETAKKLLGWQEESENLKFKSDYLLQDEKGVKIRCLNNGINRPLYRGNLLSLKQDILNKRWRMNGEPIIIGKTGLILNGQHQMIALILAAQYWKEHQGLCGKYWESEPTIDKFLVVGVEETDEVANTMDTCKSRTLRDVVSRIEYFLALPMKERRSGANATAAAIKMLWDRTGAKEDPYASIRTHSASLDFLSRHSRLLEAVKHVHEEDGGDKIIQQYVSLGTASALLYLMAVSGSEREREDGQGYVQVDVPSEAQLSFSRWEKACEFWVLLASQSSVMKPVSSRMASLIKEEMDSLSNRIALLVMAWNRFIHSKPLTSESLTLEYVTGPSGQLEAVEVPVLGGIDVGATKTSL